MVGGVSGISASMAHTSPGGVVIGLGIDSVRVSDTCRRGVVQGNSVLSELMVDIEGWKDVALRLPPISGVRVSLSVMVGESGMNAASDHTSDVVVVSALSLSQGPMTTVEVVIDKGSGSNFGGGSNLLTLWCVGIKSTSVSSL